MEKRQRLVVCLDGTWNNRDDSTNVLHHFSLVRQGEVAESDDSTIFQRKYYHEGVGTGVLDRISGGGFGFGLEENVRAAYNWLVQHFNDGTGSRAADQIFIFGFSRGAYTARSLVGFISRCGLLHRAAPLTVNQLWENYCILGREREELHESRLFRETPRFRQITDLVEDPWQITSRPFAGSDPDGVPGQKEVPNMTETERLLVRWSRRVRITYLGVYDTVGAMGSDALAIPGLKSKLALHHNMRPTTLIQSCRHALAIDENRSSFNHTPFLAYLGHQTDEGEQARGLEPGDDQRVVELDTETSTTDRGHGAEARLHWRRSQAMWTRKIEQRWFVGAHSNVGGGYPDNRLAQEPFRWVLQGATRLGLRCEDVPAPRPLTTPVAPGRDSFAEFAKPFWTLIFRAKRYYRAIDPERESQARRNQPKPPAPPAAGFSLQSINEHVDESVFHSTDATNPPPNLVEYARRQMAKAPQCANAAQLLALAGQRPRHVWLAHPGEYLVLVLWATFAAVGLAAANQLVCGEGTPQLPIWLTCLAAFLFPLVDWAESRVNFSQATGRTGPARRAFLDSIYWLRALGLVLFAMGVAVSVVQLAAIGWNAGLQGNFWSETKRLLDTWWFVPGLATIGTGIAAFLAHLWRKGSEWEIVVRARAPSGQKGFSLAPAPPAVAAAPRATPAVRVAGAGALWASVAILGGFALALVSVPVLILAGSLLAHILAPAFGISASVVGPSPADARFAGLLLMLQLSFFYVVKAFAWVGEPMARANLGSIVPLQFCWSPGRVVKRLEYWREMLVCRWLEEDPARGPASRRMCELLREALWRDIQGLIPVYFMVLVFGLRFADSQLHWEWLENSYLGAPLWILIPLLAAAADYTEDACQLSYLRRHENRLAPRAWVVAVGFAMALLKFASFGLGAGAVLGTLGYGSWQIALLGESAGWRGTIVLSISTAVILALGSLAVGAIYYRFVGPKKRKRGPQGLG